MLEEALALGEGPRVPSLFLLSSDRPRTLTAETWQKEEEGKSQESRSQLWPADLQGGLHDLYLWHLYLCTVPFLFSVNVTYFWLADGMHVSIDYVTHVLSVILLNCSLALEEFHAPRNCGYPLRLESGHFWQVSWNWSRVWMSLEQIFPQTSLGWDQPALADILITVGWDTKQRVQLSQAWSPEPQTLRGNKHVLF
jgi:hypothetical protein